MAMKRLIDGVEYKCKPEEEAAILKQWSENDRIEEEKKCYIDETEELAKKYPCLLRAIDLIYQKLGL